MGLTPTAFAAQQLTDVSEVRAGVYAFFDLVMHNVGVCELDEIALSVLTTVIGHQQEKGWIMVDAGWMGRPSPALPLSAPIRSTASLPPSLARLRPILPPCSPWARNYAFCPITPAPPARSTRCFTPAISRASPRPGHGSRAGKTPASRRRRRRRGESTERSGPMSAAQTWVAAKALTTSKARICRRDTVGQRERLPEGKQLRFKR